MKIWQLTLLSFFITAPAWATVKAYFNQNPQASYTDPYRGITRPGDNLEQILLTGIYFDVLQTKKRLDKYEKN